MKDLSSQFYFNFSKENLQSFYGQKKAVLIVDRNVASIYSDWISGFEHVVFPSGEENKTLSVIESMAQKLSEFRLTRRDKIVAVGGGVVMDAVGFLASIFQRGISCDFVPTTLLGMVDASVGGKTGVNLGHKKNYIGTFSLPENIFFDYQFLKTLTLAEWQNGWAEIIKHDCISSIEHPSELKFINPQESFDVNYIDQLVQDNVHIKSSFVDGDLKDFAQRQMLNFGHTFGHAIERNYQLSHGRAIAIGMYFEALLSERILGFQQAEKLKVVLQKFGLPVQIKVDADLVWQSLVLDKKRTEQLLHIILLKDFKQPKIWTISQQEFFPIFSDLVKQFNRINE